ncbi:MAG: hypothetical protein OXF44_00455 [Anaerolineaceae bacterium]|nr:hypothetical protein [Anaerolineaceae bacterium]
MIPRLTLLFLLAAPTLAACSDLVPSASATALPTVAVLEAPPPDTAELLTQAFHNIRSSATLRLEVQHSGEPWLIATDVGNVAFEEAGVSFVAPDTLQVDAGVRIFGLAAGVDLFARGEQQWYRNALLTGGNWQGGILVENFNPQQLVAPGSGFDRAAQALLGLTWQGLVALEDGRAAHLLSGPARGEEVSALLVNLVQLTGEVQTEVYIDMDTLLPLRFVLSQPDIATWEVRVTAVNAAVQLDAPLQAGG